MSVSLTACVYCIPFYYTIYTGKQEIDYNGVTSLNRFNTFNFFLEAT